MVADFFVSIMLKKRLFCFRCLFLIMNPGKQGCFFLVVVQLLGSACVNRLRHRAPSLDVHDRDVLVTRPNMCSCNLFESLRYSRNLIRLLSPLVLM